MPRPRWFPGLSQTQLLHRDFVDWLPVHAHGVLPSMVPSSLPFPYARLHVPKGFFPCCPWEWDLATKVEAPYEEHGGRQRIHAALP